MNTIASDLTNQQTCAFDNDKQIKGLPIFTCFIADLCECNTSLMVQIWSVEVGEHQKGTKQLPHTLKREEKRRGARDITGMHGDKVEELVFCSGCKGAKKTPHKFQKLCMSSIWRHCGTRIVPLTWVLKIQECAGNFVVGATLHHLQCLVSLTLFLGVC